MRVEQPYTPLEDWGETPVRHDCIDLSSLTLYSAGMESDKKNGDLLDDHLGHAKAKGDLRGNEREAGGPLWASLLDQENYNDSHLTFTVTWGIIALK